MPRILVADDDAWQLDLRCRLLEAGGHHVSLACCAADALRQLNQADVLVMDLRFPNADGQDDPAEGLALIRNVRASGSRIPVIVLSGWPEDLRDRPELQLVSCVLTKPVGIRNLLETIQALVSGASAPPPR